MTVLVLKDDLESVDLNKSANYMYVDDTLNITMPTRNETKFQSSYNAGRDLLTLSYSTRTITFEVYVLGATDNDVRANVSRISRMLLRASQNVYVAGGAFSQDITIDEGKNTGDQGLVFRYRLGTTNEGTIEKENGTNVTGANTLTFRIITGDIEPLNTLTTTRSISAGGGKKYKHCRITLEAEPFALGEARLVSEITGDGYEAYPISPANNQVNRAFINAADVPGDAPALTRIYTSIASGSGVIIGRDAGISLLNSTSVPVFTGSGVNDMFCYGQMRSATGKSYVVKITGTGTPNQFQYSVNGGAFSSSINITVRTPIKLGTDEVYVFFNQATGHALNDQWTFVSHQAHLSYTGSSFDLYANRASVHSATGYGVGSVGFTVPPGCRSKYRVYANFTFTGGISVGEFAMDIRFVGYNGTSRAETLSTIYDWVSARLDAAVDLGILDLTPRVTPHLLHPSGMLEGRIYFLFRSDGNVPNPTTCKVNNVFLVPCQDDYAYMHAKWVYDGVGREVFCNYDAANPYMAEVAGNQFDSSYPGIVSIVPLDGTYSGNMITLMPNVDNTLLFLPMGTALAGSGDWRHSTFSAAAKTQSTSVAIRPRFLYGG